MKVGILSMQKVINYGSYLQAYALKKLLEESGVDKVEFIDIKKGVNLKGYGKSTLKSIIKKIVNRIKIFYVNPFYINKTSDSFLLKYKNSIKNHWNILGLSDNQEINKNKKYDLVVIGSDEVFNCCQKTEWGFTKQLYGDINDTKQIVSYAGSFGNTSIEDLKKLKIDKIISETLSKLKSISVRDNNSFEIVKSLINKEPLIHIDPVLAYDFSSIINSPFKHNDRNYIVIYTYPGRIYSKNEINNIKKFANIHNKNLFTLMCEYSWCDQTIIPDSPFEVLQWFKNADFIITDTFHGTIFSIITHKNFVTLQRSSNSNKISSLLNQVGLENRIANNHKEIINILKNEPDYSIVENKLVDLRKSAKEYIKYIISI